jgi:Mn-containing catalase
MPLIRELLIDQLQDLFHAETQLTSALPKMADAAHHPKLKEAFNKHLTQTETHVERLRKIFDQLREKAQGKPCKAMMGLIAEGEETISEGQGKSDLAADLALIAAAQRVEHYEIAAYGTARTLAAQLGDRTCEQLLSYTLGEEERTDFLLTTIAAPLVQNAALQDMGGNADLEGAELAYHQRQTVSR